MKLSDAINETLFPIYKKMGWPWKGGTPPTKEKMMADIMDALSSLEPGRDVRIEDTDLWIENNGYSWINLRIWHEAWAKEKSEGDVNE